MYIISAAAYVVCMCVSSFANNYTFFFITCIYTKFKLMDCTHLRSLLIHVHENALNCTCTYTCIYMYLHVCSDQIIHDVHCLTPSYLVQTIIIMEYEANKWTYMFIYHMRTNTTSHNVIIPCTNVYTALILYKMCRIRVHVNVETVTLFY